MAGNDLRFVRETARLLEGAGIVVWVFGGWAEELLSLAEPRLHKDLDLLYPADGFAVADAVLMAGCGPAEITAKRLAHKRAFTRQAVMTELILVRPAGEGYVTDFRGQLTYQWPGDVLGPRSPGCGWPARQPSALTAPITPAFTRGELVLECSAADEEVAGPDAGLRVQDSAGG